MTLKYFQLSEFDSPDEPGSGENMQPSTLEMLDEARQFSGCPYVINSGYRTVEHNKTVNGKSSSSHLTGYAADIKVKISGERFAIVAGLLEAGFTRIGIGKTFIHADNDPDKPPFVMWDYY